MTHGILKINILLFQISYLPLPLPVNVAFFGVRFIIRSFISKSRKEVEKTQPNQKEELVVSPFMSLFVRIHSASLPSLHSLHLLVFLFSLASLRSTLSLAIFHSFLAPISPLFMKVSSALPFE